MPFISLILIFASIILIILSFYIGSNSEVFVKITVTIGIVSVLFTIIVENTLKLGERYFALQIGVYILIVYLLVIILLALWSIWSGFNTFFWVVAIVGISGLIALRVLSKKEVHAELSDEEEYVRISKKEYEYLLNRSKLLDELTAKEEE